MADKKLKAEIILGGKLDASLRAMAWDARSSFRMIGVSIRDAEKKQKALNKTIEKFKNSSGRLNSDTIKASYDRLTAAIDRTKDAVKRLHAAEAQRARLANTAGQLYGVAGRAAIGAGVGGAALGSTITEASKFQTEAARLQIIGVPDVAKIQALQAGRELKNFGTSIRENVEAYNDGLAIFGNMKEARMAAPLMQKMAFANKALFGTSDEESERQQKNMLRVIDIRGGANDAGEFKRQSDYIQRAYVASKGMVTGEEFFKAVQHGGTAIRGMTNEAFYYKFLPLIQEMHGDQFGTAAQTAYNGLVQGHTSKRAAINLMGGGLISDPSKVKFDKAGQIAQFNPGALKNTDQYIKDPTEWVRNTMLPALVQSGKINQKTMADALAGKLDDSEKQRLTTVIGSLGNTNLGKFLSLITMSLPQIERDSRNARNSQGIEGSANAARNTAAGQTLGLKANVNNLRLNLGETLLPTYTTALTKLNTALERLNGFITKHPKLTRAMTVATAGVTAAMAASVPVLITAGAAMNIYGGFVAIAARREAILAASQLKVVTGTAKRLSLFARLRSIIPRIGTLFAALTGPVGIAVAVIGAAAFVTYKYWDRVKAFFTGFGQGLAKEFSPIIPIIRPIFVSISNGAKTAWRWITSFLTPVHTTVKALQKFGVAGQVAGQMIGEVFKVITLITPAKILIESAKEVISHWQVVVNFFDALGEKINNFFHPVGTMLEKLKNFSGKLGTPIIEKFHKLDEWAYGKNTEKINFPKASANQAMNKGGDTHYHTYNITQQPGQSPHDLAKEIHKLTQQNSRRGIALADGAD